MPRKTEFDNSGRKEETWVLNRNVQIVNRKGKCGLSAILPEGGQSAQVAYCEVIVAKCSFPASEQLSGNRSSATESWTIGTGYLRWLWTRILCRRSNQDMTDK